MPERESLSRDLADDEIPEDVDETLEEARTTHRKPPTSRLRSGGSEEKEGTEEKPRTVPTPESRTAIKPPPLKPRQK
jgi:hypothetical protein